MTTIQSHSTNPHSLQPNSQPSNPQPSNPQTSNPQPSNPRPSNPQPSNPQSSNPQPPITNPQPTTSQPTPPPQQPAAQPQPSTSKQPNVQSNINNLCPPPLQPIITNQSNQTTNSPFQYMHTFRYSFDKNKIKSSTDNIDLIAHRYDRIMGITPTQFDFVDNNSTCMVTILSSKETLHTPENLKHLDTIGLTLKLNSNQSEKNSLFCINGPLRMRDTPKQQLIKNINKDNPHIYILDIYILPLKSPNQRTLSFKLTIATQKMTNYIIQNGLHICQSYVNPTQLSRSKVLNTIQCSKCQNYTHGYNNCKSIKNICPHCTLDHELKACPNKSNPSLCNNCKGNHRTTSNNCPIRRKFLIIPRTHKDINTQNSLRKNPESSYFSEAPPPTFNPWTGNHHSQNAKSPLLPTPNFPPIYNHQNFNAYNPSTSYPQPLIPNNNSSSSNLHKPHTYTNNTTPPIPNSNTSLSPNNNNNNTSNSSTFSPNITYDQILAMATRFNDWPVAFKELQKAFNISPVIEIPPILHNQLKPNYHKINQFDQSTLPITPPLAQSPLSSIPPSSPSLPDLTKQTSPLNIIPPSTSTPSNTPHTKNNFKNNKNKNQINSMPPSSPTNSITSSQSYPLTPIPKLNDLLKSPEADDPLTLNSTPNPSPSNSPNTSSSSSNKSIDILNNSEDNTTVVHNNNKEPHSPNSPDISPNSTPSTLKSKKKLINKIISPQSNESIGPLSPIERKAIKLLRARTRRINYNYKNNKTASKTP